MLTHPNRFLGIALLLAVLLVASGSVFAASTEYEWGGASSIYSNDANWTPVGGPPTNTDSAVFGTTGSYTVTFDRNERSDYLYVTNSNTVLFDLGGNTYTINSPAQTDRIVIGSNSTDNVTLIVENGTFDASFNSSRTELNLGMEGSQASLIVSNGAQFLANYIYANYAGSTGQVVVTGAGSYLQAETGFQGQSATEDMPFIVRDGAGAEVRGPYWDKQEVIGGTLTNAGGNARLIFNGGGYVRVIDGGTIVMNSGENALGVHAYGGTAQVLGGDGSGPGT
ncbi:hypothetical protein HQ590_14705, partial [bacterium]|nr:hypothetical protein [bacterium]